MQRLLFLLIPLCMSCMWDRDTLKDEGEGRMDTVKVIVGWFDRYPPEYYQVRLDRVLAELAQEPSKLALYDDAGVALDRLHRSDEAIALMAEKKATLNRLQGSLSEEVHWEHHYRYLANLGTFYVHRWIGREQTVRNADLGDLVRAEELIAAAIEHNPNAHFGREKYQLMTIRWLQETSGDYLHGPVGNLLETKYSKAEIEKALQGFLGMIKLGAAWESTDLFKIIAELNSAEGNRVLAHLASLRVEELQDADRSSLHPHPDALPFRRFGGTTDHRKKVIKWYHEARKAADQRQESRWTYLRKGLAEGRHPDTDPDFWKGWEDDKFPPLPGKSLFNDLFSRNASALIVIASIALLTPLWIFSLCRRRKRRRLLESIKVVGMTS